MLKDVLSRVEQRLAATGLSAARASADAGLSKDAIRNMQRAAKDPASRQGVSTRTINALAPVLMTTPGWLLTGEGAEEATDEPVLLVPVISWVSASGLVQSDYVSEIESAPKKPVAGLYPHGQWIALRVEGDSMDRISPPDSVIFVDTSQKTLVPNACYVIADEGGRATYKRWRPSPDRWEPVSTNPEHEPIFVAPDRSPRIVGRVVRTMLDLD